MSTIKKYNLSGSVVGELAVDEQSLQISANPQMIKDYIVAIRNNARQWSASTKNRTEVNHSGQKPHPQKGTGKARQGYLGAAQYKGGGRVHTPRPKFDQHVRINKKERRAANRHLIVEKIHSGNVHVLCFETMKEPKTKTVYEFLKALNLAGKRVLFLSQGLNASEVTMQQINNGYETFKLSIRNLQKTELMQFPSINAYDLAVAHEIVIFDNAVDEMLVLLGGNK